VIEIDPWVPVAVSAVRSFGIGAMVGAFVSHKLGKRAERRREGREKRGLLRLVSIEIGYNEKQCQMLRAIPSYVFSDQIDLIKMDTWASSRTMLAQLLPNDDLDQLTCYYAPLQELVSVGRSPAYERWQGVPVTTRSVEDRAKELLDRLEEARMSVNQMIERHLGSTNRINGDNP
jgi:hypothetical protein